MLLHFASLQLTVRGQIWSSEDFSRHCFNFIWSPIEGEEKETTLEAY